MLSASPLRMLAVETVVKMLADRKAGATYEALTSKYKVTYRTVYTICTGQTRLSKEALKLMKAAAKKRRGIGDVMKVMRRDHATKKSAA